MQDRELFRQIPAIRSPWQVDRVVLDLAEGDVHRHLAHGSGQDRLGSDISGNKVYLPYGEELTATANGRDKWATYYRDTTGLDYADHRYYGPGTGRFLTADPYGGSANPTIPWSWNRYSYVLGDPVNLVDPNGLCACRWEEVAGGTPRISCIGCGNAGGVEGRRSEEEVGIGDNGLAVGTETDWWLTLPAWGQTLRTQLTNGLPKPCDDALAKLDSVQKPHQPISAAGLLGALNRAEFRDGVKSNDRYMDLFPGRQAPSLSMASMTVGEYFARNPGVTALAALGGNKIYFRSGPWSATIMHELLHNLGLEDDDVQTALGISGPSREISNYLWENCLKPPVFLLQ